MLKQRCSIARPRTNIDLTEYHPLIIPIPCKQVFLPCWSRLVFHPSPSNGYNMELEPQDKHAFFCSKQTLADPKAPVTR